MSDRVKEVRAAGGVLWEDVDGELRVLVVRRPLYGDWSFPKGKIDPGESDLDCAVREMFEETGYRVVVEDPLPEVAYTDHKGRPKTVAYWAMRRADPSEAFVPNDEVDEARWLGVDEARGLLSYELDRHLLGEFIRQRVERG